MTTRDYNAEYKDGARKYAYQFDTVLRGVRTYMLGGCNVRNDRGHRRRRHVLRAGRCDRRHRHSSADVAEAQE